MPKIINRRIEMHVDQRGRPRRFFFRGWHDVDEIVDIWREVGEWWERPSERTVYRVRTRPGGLFEVEFHRLEKCWYLYKSYD